MRGEANEEWGLGLDKREINGGGFDIMAIIIATRIICSALMVGREHYR